jgi:transposase
MIPSVETAMKTSSYVGLDVHRNLVVATALNAAGKQIRQSSFGPAPKELISFLRRLPKPTKVVMEACSVWERYYKAAKSTGAEVVLSHPLKTRMIAEASIKTDKVDSATLANLLRLNSIPLVYIPDPQVRALRKLYLDRLFYARIRTSVMRHVYSRLAERGIDYKRDELQHRARRAKFRKLEITEVTLALDTLDDVEKRCVQFDSRVHDLFLESRDAQLLATIPGIGELTAVGLAGFICPVSRFPSSDKLTSYAGLCPTIHQSSDTAYLGHLKNDCNRGLRSLIVEASWRHRVHEPRGDVGRCARRVSRSKGKMFGTVAGAHKLLRIVYAILKQRRAFQPHAPERPVSSQQLRGLHSRSASSYGMRRATRGSSRRIGPHRSSPALSHRATRVHRVGHTVKRRATRYAKSLRGKPQS